MGLSNHESTKKRVKTTKRKRNEDSSQDIWSTYGHIYDILAVNPDEVLTTEECVANTRVIEVATSKLIDDVQKLDLSSVDLWSDIAERLVNEWNKFFYTPENTGDWSLGDVAPLNLYKSNYFHLKSVSLNRENKPAQKQKKTRVARAKDSSSQTRMAKPLQGLSEDKPPLLMENMERIKSTLSKLCSPSKPSVSYMKLVLHPTSFSHTIYNIFTVAFLLRENMVSLTIGENYEPLVHLESNFYSGSSQISSQSKISDRQKNNFLIPLTTAEWQMLVKKLEISYPLIPPPDGINNNDAFFERFTMSQREKKRVTKL